VTYALPTSTANATLSAATATTDAAGVASVTATANATVGAYQVTASVAGITNKPTFALTNTAGAAASLSATGGSVQSTIISSAFGTALQVTVVDGTGNPVPGITVTYAAPASGASATLSATTAVTNASGIASVTATANALPGTYSIIASVAGVANKPAFSLTNIGTPGLQLTVSASQTSVTNPGQVVVFSYVLKNTGNISITGIVLTDAKVSGISCPATSLAPSASMTCTASYVTTAADIANKAGIVSVARASSSSIAGVAASATVTTPVGINIAAVQKQTVDANRGLMQNRAQALTSMTPNGQRLMHRLTSWIFGGSDEQDETTTVAERPDPRNDGSLKDGSLKDRVSKHEPLKAVESPDDAGNSGTGSTSPGGARGSSVLGMPAPANIGGARSSDTAFARVRDAMSAEGGRTSSSPVAVSGDAEDGNARLNFSSSLSQMRAAAESDSAAKIAVGGAGKDPVLNLGSSSGDGRRRKTSDFFDVWVEGQSSFYNNTNPSNRSKGHVAVLYTGADVIVAPGISLGALVQRDWISETSTAPGSSSAATSGQKRDGAGWMAGPYVGLRLTRHIYFDARYAWGTATNHVDPVGAYTDMFSTRRALASGRLTGDWAYGPWRLRPSAEATYFTEQQKTYVNQIGISIPDTRVTLGRATFGPEVAYRFNLPGKAVLEPYIGIKGAWNFAKDSDKTAIGGMAAPDGLMGQFEAGASYRASNGITVRATGAYDGIGSSSYHAVRGQAFVVVPLN
jgi:uncharacterized repeat protein (TIGR01451 family)